jgi:hypothetical protein
VQHELIQIALNRWMLEYWDNPSDFTWEDFLPMMKVREHMIMLGEKSDSGKVETSMQFLHPREVLSRYWRKGSIDPHAQAPNVDHIPNAVSRSTWRVS